MTFELWFRPESLSAKQNLISKWLDGANPGVPLLYLGGRAAPGPPGQQRQRDRVGMPTASQSSLAGSWHHVAVTADGRGGANAAAGITLYIDGLPVPLTRNNHAAYVSMENWTVPLQLGRESSRFRQFDGSLDEIRLWNVARAQAQNPGPDVV